LAPEGAQLSVEAGESDGFTDVRLEVTGLLPDRGYAAHVHERPCGSTGAAAGPHYQHEVDPAATPEQPSTDPAFANPRNEIWLDLRTDGDGYAEVTAGVPFVFSGRAPASVVIHQSEATATGPGEAGSAGARVACLNVPFEQAANG
jgi:Cu-Zn family superoxide dismutase